MLPQIQLLFKEAGSPDITGMTESGIQQMYGLIVWSCFKQKKRALYDTAELAKHFTVNSCKGFTSKVIGRIRSGREDDSAFR